MMAALKIYIFFSPLVNAHKHNFNEFTKYADVNSFVDMYILIEIIKSTDVGWQSFYFVKEKSGK